MIRKKLFLATGYMYLEEILPHDHIQVYRRGKGPFKQGCLALSAKGKSVFVFNLMYNTK